MSQRWWLSIFSGRGIQRGKQREREVSISPGVVGSSIAGVAPPGGSLFPGASSKGKTSEPRGSGSSEPDPGAPGACWGDEGTTREVGK